MFWNAPRRWLAWLRSRKLVATNFDQRLVASLHAKKLPSWSQIKYIDSFLNNFEKRILLGCFIIGLASTLALCGLAVARNIVIGPTNGGNYTEALIGQPKYINPLFSDISDVDSDIVSLVYSGLFKRSPGKEPLPELAQNYTISADGKTITINLRHDIKWSDGKPLTAEDVVFTIETAQNPEVGSPLLRTFQGVKVLKLNDYTVQFSLKQPFAYFINSLTVGILPVHIWADISPSSMRLAGNNLHPVGAGPWMFDKLSKDSGGTIQSYTLKHNPYYFKKYPFLQTFTFKFFNDYAEAVGALRGQDVMGLSFIPRDSKNKIPTKSFSVFSLQLPQYTALFFNQTKQPQLKNDDLRKALSLVINKNSIVTNALSGEGSAINSPTELFSPNSFKTPSSTNGLEESVALLDKTWNRIQPEEYFKLRSAELMKELASTGTTTATNTSTETTENTAKQIAALVRGEMGAEQPYYRKNKNNDILSLTITTADTPEYRQTGELVARFWRSLGIVVNFQFIDSHQILHQIIKPRNYEILLYGEILGDTPDLFSFWHSSQAEYPGLNLSLYANRNADKILEEARVTSDFASRMALYKKFDDLLKIDMPAIFLYSPSFAYAIQKDIQGIEIHNLSLPSDRFDNITSWYSKTSWTWKK